MTQLQGLTIELISGATGETISETHFVDNMKTLSQLEKKVQVTVNDFTDTLTVRLKFDPPLKFDDQPPPPEAGA